MVADGEYKKLAGAIEDGTLNKRVIVALYRAMLTIVQEDPTTANHVNRLAYAKKVISDDLTETLAPRYVRAIAVMAPDADSLRVITDDQLQAAVNAAVDLWTVVGA